MAVALLKDGKAKGAKKNKSKKTKKGNPKKNAEPSPPTPSEPPPPEPPTFARLYEYRFASDMAFLESLDSLNWERPSYVLFRSTEWNCHPPTGKLSLEECLYLNFIDMLKDPESVDINYYIVDMGKDTVMESPLASRPGLLLSVVPTFLRWPREKKLEGEELYDASLVAFYFQQEIQRNSRKFDTTGDFCPFRPPPPPPPSPSPQPSSPALKGTKPTKKDKGNKGKGKNKGKAKKKK